jgi:nitroreductase
VEFIEVLKARRSIRAFKPDPVPMDTLRKIMEQSLWAPSWANTQPWEFAVASGHKLKEIVKQYIAKGEEKPYPDIARPPEFPEPYMSRIRALQPPGGKAPTKEDMDKRRIQSFSHYGAPVVIYVLIDRSFYYQAKGTNVWSLYDCGAIDQNIGLLATNYGLGTVQQAQAVTYPDILRKVLGVPESKLFAIGIALGYPDWDNPAMKGPRTTREPVEKVVKHYGF